MLPTNHTLNSCVLMESYGFFPWSLWPNWKNTRLLIAKSSSGCLSSISMGHGFRSKLLVTTSGYLVFNQDGTAYWAKIGCGKDCSCWISPVKFVGMVVSWHDLGKCPWHITWGWKIFRKVWDLTGNPWISCGFYTRWGPPAIQAGDGELKCPHLDPQSNMVCWKFPSLSIDVFPIDR